jgi:hypothetical protein
VLPLAAVATTDGGVGQAVEIIGVGLGGRNDLASGVEANLRTQPGFVGDYYLVVGRDDYVHFHDIDP